MFLHMLNDDQKRAFAALGTQADCGRRRRRRPRSRKAARAGWRDEPRTRGMGQQREHRKLAASFTDRRSKVVALLELLGFAYSDTSFQAVEESMVNEVASAMNVSGDDLKRLETWVGQARGTTSGRRSH